MKKTIAFILSALMALSLFSCGGAIPETPPETPAATPETVTTPVTPNEPITPDAPDIQPRDPNEVLSELLPLATDAYGNYWLILTEDAPFLSVELAQSIVVDSPSIWNYVEVVGQPHVAYYEDSMDDRYLFSRNPIAVYYYVIEDGSVLKMNCTIGYDDEEVTIYNTLDEIKSLHPSPDPIPVSAQTYAAVYAEMVNRKYMQISERTTYLKPVDVKKVTDQMTLDNIIAQLGEPHFMQIEEIQPPDLDVNPRIFCIYILAEGDVLFVQGEAFHSKASDVQILKPDKAIELMSEIMYY